MEGSSGWHTQTNVEYISRVRNISSSLSPWADLDILWYDLQWRVVSLLGANLTIANNFDRAKYGLAIVNELLTVFGKDLGLGYDIACLFKATIWKSSIAAAAAELQLRLCVPSFHGFAHNQWCQLHNHPLYIRCFGLEDLEICEWVFAASNGCAKLTRHSTQFHRLQFLDMHFAQWDDDKYAELSMFLFTGFPHRD